MKYLFALFVLSSVAVFVLGMVKPSIVLKWLGERRQTRLYVLLLSAGLFICSLVISSLSPEMPMEQNSVQTEQPKKPESESKPEKQAIPGKPDPFTVVNHSNAKYVNASIVSPWPLKIADGVVYCYKNGTAKSATIKSRDGVEYALNGTAKSIGQPVDRIWLDNADNPGSKISMGALIKTATDLCK